MQIVDDSGFASQVTDAPGITLVDFWAEWCGPCKMLIPNLLKVEEMYAGRIKFCKMDVDNNLVTPAKLGVRGIPALLAFKDGQVVMNKAGAKTVDQLKQMFDQLLADHGATPEAEVASAPVADEPDFLSGVVPQCPTDGSCEACQ